MPENANGDREGHSWSWRSGGKKKENAAPHYYLTSWSGLETWSGRLNTTCPGWGGRWFQSSKNSLWRRRTMKSPRPTKAGVFAESDRPSQWSYVVLGFSANTRSPGTHTDRRTLKKWRMDFLRSFPRVDIGCLASQSLRILFADLQHTPKRTNRVDAVKKH